MKNLNTTIGGMAAGIALLFDISAHAQQFQFAATKATEENVIRALKWEAAVKPDVPAMPAQKEVVKAVVKSAFNTSAPVFYSTQQNMPPLPFNPFPKLDVFDLGDNKFAYDDRAIDYFALSESSKATPSPARLGSFSESVYNYSINDLWLNITKTNAADFLLDVRNMTPGVYYGVGAKNVLDNDPFNTWALAAAFEAESTNEQLIGTASAPTRFYNAVNLDEYVGPIVSIVSPTSGDVSGNAPLQVRVSDILPLVGLKVYVGGIQAGVIQPGQNGLTTLPSYLFPNGEQEIWVEAVNEGVPADTDGDGIADDVLAFYGWANATLNFTNDVYLENYSPLYSAAGSIALHYVATSPQDYTFEVFNLNGDLLHTENGQSVDGSINPEWNFTDLLGNSVSDSGYAFSLAYSPVSSGASPKKILTTNVVDHGVSVGKYVTSYGTWPRSDLNSGLASLCRNLSIDVNIAAQEYEDTVGHGRDAYNIIKADFSSDPFPIRQATQTNDLLALTNALADANVGSWFFDGHSDQTRLILGSDYYLTIELNTKQMAALLGNSIGPSSNGFTATYSRRLFSTFLTGCGAARGLSEWPDATGTPVGVDQVANTQMKKSAFLGFTGLSYPGSTKFGWIDRIHQLWLDENDYDTPLFAAVNNANGAYPDVLNWGPRLIGYPLLKYNGEDSR